MRLDVDKIKENESEFVADIRAMSEIDQIDMLTEATIPELRRMSKELPGTFEAMLHAITPRALTELQRKMTPGASPNRPDEQRYALVSVVNERQRSIFNILFVALVAYMYRALSERTQSSTAHMFLDSYTPDEAAVIRRFLGSIFEYNPTQNIDRMTSEIIAPSMDKRNKRASTATVTVNREPTRVIDSTIRAKAGEKKDRMVERSSANIGFDDGINVKIDPPLDFYANFMTYFTTHFDAVHKTAAELFIGNRVEDVKDGESRYLSEEVIIRELDPEHPEDHSKAKIVRQFTLPMAKNQWNQCVTVYAPAKTDGFFHKLEDAEHELRVIKDRTVCDMIIVEANKPTLLAPWAAGRANIIVEDEYAAALLKRFEDDNKMYAQMNNQRVKQSAFLNMIEQGENSAEFYEYLKEVAPHSQGRTLDEWDETELRNMYHAWVAENKIYSNADVDFMNFVHGKFPGRDFARNPMNATERKQLSREFALGHGVSEITDSDMMACDIFEFGTNDVSKPGTVKKTREYFHGATNVSGKKKK